MKTKIVISVALSASLLSAAEYTLSQIEANGDIGYLESSKTIDSQSSQTFNKKGIELFSGQAAVSPLKVINMAPSVNFEGVDVFGSNESSYHEPIRIRGRNQSGPGGIISIEGLPVSMNPGGGKTIYDMENFSSVELYKGYMPVDQGLGFSNLIGKVDMSFLRPKKTMSADLSQMIGSDNASKTFVRLDSGKYENIAIFGSASYTTANKWKGSGNLTRLNGTVGLSYTPTDNLTAEIYYVSNDASQDNYRQLTFSQVQNIKQNNKLDYGSSSKLSAYYDYNKQNFSDSVALANISYKFLDDSKLSIKPYFASDVGQYWFDNTPTNATNTTVVNWQINHNLYGAVAEYNKNIIAEALDMKLGYWYGDQQPPGPPTSQKKYNVASGTPVFAGWAVLAKNNDSIFNSPFLQFTGSKNSWDYSAGVRYMNFKLGSLTSYTNGNTTATANQDYNSAISSSVADPFASVSAKTFNIWLPSAFLAYSATKDLQLYGDYSKTYGLDVNLFPTFVQNRAAFAAQNVTLQQLWNQVKLETSDNYELGVKYKNSGITYNPDIYFSNIQNKQASNYLKPTTAYPNVAYPANMFNAQAYGAELSVYGNITDSLNAFVSGSYNRYYYTSQIPTAYGRSIDVQGNQVPDAPKYLARGALTYTYGAWSISPVASYSAGRCGDIQNTQCVAPYTLVNLDASYTAQKLLGSKEAIFKLTLTNLTNTQYVAAIITPDNALSANTTQTTYQTGAPFGMYATVNFKF